MTRIDWLLMAFNVGLFAFLLRWLLQKRADRRADVRPRCKHGVDKLRGPKCQACQSAVAQEFAQYEQAKKTKEQDPWVYDKDAPGDFKIDPDWAKKARDSYGDVGRGIAEDVYRMSLQRERIRAAIFGRPGDKSNELKCEWRPFQDHEPQPVAPAIRCHRCGADSFEGRALQGDGGEMPYICVEAGCSTWTTPLPKFKVGQWVRTRSEKLGRVLAIEHLKAIDLYRFRIVLELNSLGHSLVPEFLDAALPRVGEWWRWTVRSCPERTVEHRPGIFMVDDMFIARNHHATLGYEIACGCLEPVNFGKGI